MLNERLGNRRHLISSMDRGLGGHHLGLLSHSLVGNGPIDEDSPTPRWALGQGTGVA